MGVEWRGFELHPETPRGGMPLSALFGPARAEAMHAYLVDFAAGFGVTGMQPPTHLPNTRRVLAIAELARDEGVLPAFRAAAFDAHWREGRDLEADADLRVIAETAGLDPEAAIAATDDPAMQARVDAMRAEASARGVTGIPTWFIGDERVVGCVPVSQLAAVVRRVAGRG